MSTWQAQQDHIKATCRRLIDQHVIEPLSTAEGEASRWNLCELASLIEGHFHIQLNLTGLSEIERLAYESRASWDRGPLPTPHSEWRHPFWLLDDGRRVGTLAVPTMISGRDLISVSSLYVDPAARRGNIARRALEAVFRAGLELGAGGLRLDTSWIWQPAVRFYARIGMWVRSWKHNLVFTWQANLPPYRVEIGETEARFLIEQDGGWLTKVTARNLGDRLGWEPIDLEPRLGEPFYCIPGTFALHLALAGWPLIRSDETWERRHNWSDAVQPEGLAYKIEIFEAIDRERGFDVRTPRIPGLEYRDLDEI
ncbi:MAG TPA: GNAT family N-acetyltransferase [Thermoanaerobaculia bacterium]|jgi:GNAT superfamily N-acetyltransferase|nr:GNAT family N-acetyltransferase [Thermoanaerobaculia bacterium]